MHLWLLNAGKIFLHIEKNKQKTKTLMDHNAHLRYSSFAQKDDYVIILIKRKKIVLSVLTLEWPICLT